MKVKRIVDLEDICYVLIIWLFRLDLSVIGEIIIGLMVFLILIISILVNYLVIRYIFIIYENNYNNYKRFVYFN